MVDMTPARWKQTNQYIQEVFGKEDASLAQLQTEAIHAGLPDIAIDASVGRLLLILTASTRAGLAIEVGTLGGYSAAWIARGLAAHGKLITIEINPKHAEFAQRQFQRLGFADRVHVQTGDGVDVLQSLTGELTPGSVDMVFLDGEKQQYGDYWKLARPLIAVGGLIVIDNALGSSSWWIGDDHPARHAVDTVCRTIANDPDFESIALPLRQGVLVGRRMR